MPDDRPIYSGPRNLESADGSLFVRDGRYEKAVFSHVQGAARPETVREEQSIGQLAAEYGVHPTQLGKWKALAFHGLPSLFEERAEVGALKATHQAQLTALNAEIGRLTTQVAWFKRRLGLPH